LQLFITRRRENRQVTRSQYSANYPFLKIYETCETRTDFTTGERRWRSANRVAFSLSV
jgi:hypothetical protein